MTRLLLSRFHFLNSAVLRQCSKSAESSLMAKVVVYLCGVTRLVLINDYDIFCGLRSDETRLSWSPPLKIYFLILILRHWTMYEFLIQYVLIWSHYIDPSEYSTKVARSSTLKSSWEDVDHRHNGNLVSKVFNSLPELECIRLIKKTNVIQFFEQRSYSNISQGIENNLIITKLQ